MDMLQLDRRTTTINILQLCLSSTIRVNIIERSLSKYKRKDLLYIVCKNVQHHTWRVACFLFADDTDILNSLKAKRGKFFHSALNCGGASKI